MATQLSVNVYRINSSNEIPLASLQKIGFPTGNIQTRGTAAAGILLGTGVRVYGWIQTANGDQFYTVETQAALATLAG